MWKSSLRVRLGIFCPLVLLLAASAPLPQTETALVQLMEDVGAEPAFYMMHHGSRTTSAYGRAEVPQMMSRLAKDMDLGPVKSISVADGLRWNASGYWTRNLRVELNVINDKPQSNFVKPYISVRVEGHGLPDHRLSQARKRLVHVLRLHGIEPRTHFSVQGMVHSSEGISKKKIVDQVLTQLGAHEVESMKSSHTVSVSAYTPLFTGGLKTKGGRMNLQAAVKTSDDHRIILTLGTPIITIEY